VAIALGGLSYAHRPALGHIVRLRNRFEHDMDTTLTAADAKRLASSLPASVRETYDKRIATTSPRSWTPLGLVMTCLFAIHVEMAVLTANAERGN
jgi:hypothetical protein